MDLPVALLGSRPAIPVANSTSDGSAYCLKADRLNKKPSRIRGRMMKSVSMRRRPKKDEDNVLVRFSLLSLTLDYGFCVEH